jgi:steroid delta-isomerase
MDAQHIRQLYDRYPDLLTKGDVDAIVDLYADDGTVEDPIGSDLYRGKQAIRDFYAASAGTVTMKRTGPVRVAGLEAACPLVVLMGPEGPDQKALDIISTMVFDESGKIKQMRAYWSFDGMRSANEQP